jgi:hypothetical protein
MPFTPGTKHRNQLFLKELFGDNQFAPRALRADQDWQTLPLISQIRREKELAKLRIKPVARPAIKGATNESHRKEIRDSAVRRT